MAGHGGAVCVRQRSSSSNVELRVCKRWGLYAPVVVFFYFYFYFYFFLLQHHSALVQCMPLSGRLNVGADAISHNKLVVLFDSKPDLTPSPSTLLQTLPVLVEPEAPNWTSPNWGALLGSSIVWR